MRERRLILGVDIGTSGLKLGCFDAEQFSAGPVATFHRSYEVRTREGGLWSDIDPAQWQAAFRAGLRELGGLVTEVEVVSLSGTTPGLTAVDAAGRPVYPAILMLDQRSRAEAAELIGSIGHERLLRETANVPVAGGCSLASLLWLRRHEPEAFGRARWFVHSNGFFTTWLAGEPAMDPSSASLTGLYDTAAAGLLWREDTARACGLDPAMLPPLCRAAASVGRVLPPLARELGLARQPAVVVGGNDAVLAAHSLGVREPGEVVNVNGTCEITLVCMGACHASASYNVRCHVVPDRWLTLYVMNAQGKAYEWFRSVFCSELTAGEFYERFLPGAVEAWIGRPSGVEYVPYLLGSRYSQEPLAAEFRGLTPTVSREEILAALVRGLCSYQKAHLDEVAALLPLSPRTLVAGGAVNPALVRAKQAWTRPGEYLVQAESSVRGAALLGLEHLEGCAGR